MDKVNVAVFISGNGTDLQSLIDAQEKTLLHGRIAFVLSSKESAYGIERARNANIPVLCLNEKKVGNDIFYSTLEKHLRVHGVDFIVLAGYLPILANDFTTHWSGRIINIHPSLLPKYGGKGFYGLRIHQAVLDNKDPYTGATIHYVTGDLDGGEIIAQERIRVSVKSAEELQAAVLREIEWKLLPATVEKLCKDYLAMDKRYLTIAILGSGGREHALVRKVSESPLVNRILCIPGNDGIIEAENISVPIDYQDDIILLLKKERVDLCIVGPEKPLSEGIVDRIQDAGIACFGPCKKAAQIESSKVFAKKMMLKYNIPTAPFVTFDRFSLADQHIEKCQYPIVIKADGLCGGKGVFICNDKAEAYSAIDELMQKETFGESGAKIIIEEKLNGIEISVFILTDGERYILLPSAKDYKRAYDGDIGPNTGGMGAIAPHPIWNSEIQNECVQSIIIPTLEALKQEGIRFQGCLYFGLMLTGQGLRVLEYNCRFGDPETEVVLSLIEEDIVPYLFDCAKGRLKDKSLKIADRFCCAVVLAAKGYPNNYLKGEPISNIIHNDVICAGVRFNKEGFQSNSGRVICAIGVGESKELAIQEAYKRVDTINCDALFFRKDIGQ